MREDLVPIVGRKRYLFANPGEKSIRKCARVLLNLFLRDKLSTHEMVFERIVDTVQIAWRYAR